MLITYGLVEQHIHGAFGYDFMNCSVDDFLTVSELLSSCGVTAFFPTIMTDSIDVIKDRIDIVKQAMSKQKKDSAQLIGIHLEGPFINPKKSGIHDKKYILPLDIELYKKIEDEIIKIITIAPELDFDESFINYLKSKDVKISVGHSIATDLSSCNQTTHLYNAMGAFSHRGASTVVSALSNDDIFIELIADSMHVSDEVLKLTFMRKKINKVLLVSDALPMAHSELEKQKFAGKIIYNKNGLLVDKKGVIAGSSMLLCDIVKNLVDKNILNLKDAVQAASFNQLNYHNINNNIQIYWNDSNKIDKIEFI